MLLLVVVVVMVMVMAIRKMGMRMAVTAAAVEATQGNKMIEHTCHLHRHHHASALTKAQRPGCWRSMLILLDLWMVVVLLLLLLLLLIDRPFGYGLECPCSAAIIGSSGCSDCDGDQIQQEEPVKASKH